MKSFFILILLLILGINFYISYRIRCMIPPGIGLRSVALILQILVFVCFFVPFVWRNLPSPILSICYKTGTSWFFISIYVVMIFLLLDLIRVTHLLPVEKYMYNSWTGIGCLTLIVTLIMTFGYINYRNKERVELSLSIPGKEFSEPLKILAISDLHLGYSIGNDELKKWVELINAENADIVLIAGDIVDNDTRPLFEQKMDETLKTIKSKYGVYAAPGNHDYISGISESSRFMEMAGIHFLRDSAALIDDRFYVVGRDDRSNPDRKSVKELTEKLNHAKPIILLDHQPYHLEQFEQNRIDLAIAGHTHRGQIWPVSWITDWIYEDSHGYLKKGNTHIYVSSGIGLWGGKFRIGTQSEYVVIELK